MGPIVQHVLGVLKWSYVVLCAPEDCVVGFNLGASCTDLPSFFIEGQKFHTWGEFRVGIVYTYREVRILTAKQSHEIFFAFQDLRKFMVSANMFPFCVCVDFMGVEVEKFVFNIFMTMFVLICSIVRMSYHGC